MSKYRGPRRLASTFYTYVKFEVHVCLLIMSQGTFIASIKSHFSPMYQQLEHLEKDLCKKSTIFPIGHSWPYFLFPMTPLHFFCWSSQKDSPCRDEGHMPSLFGLQFAVRFSNARIAFSLKHRFHLYIQSMLIDIFWILQMLIIDNKYLIFSFFSLPEQFKDY